MLAGAEGQHRMARPYSQDLRDRVVNSVAGGRTCRATAALFGVSVASVVKWSQRWRASGSAAAKQMGGWRQLVAELVERGTPASYGAVWGFFKHAGITFKKLCTPASRIASTSLAAGAGGRRIRAGLTPSA